MDKIESLTPEQQEKLEVFRNEWLAVGLATGPANLDAVREPITAMYEELGYDAPAFVRCRSPLEAQLIINLLRGGLGDLVLAAPIPGDTLTAENMRDAMAKTVRIDIKDGIHDALYLSWNEPHIMLDDDVREKLNDDLQDGMDAIFNQLDVMLVGNAIDNMDTALRARMSGDLDDGFWSVQDDLYTTLCDDLRDQLSDPLSIHERVLIGEHWFTPELTENLCNNIEKGLLNDLRTANHFGVTVLLSIVNDTLRDDLREKLEGAFWRELRELGYDLGSNVGRNVPIGPDVAWGDMIHEIRHISPSIRDQLVDIVAKTKFEYVPTSLWGSLDAYWVAWYLFPHEVLRPMHTDEQMEKLNRWATIAKNAFWWYPFKGVCFVCDRPDAIHRDDEGRLHCEDGPAVGFSDGYGVYAVHGVRVPRYVIEQPDQITVEAIDEEVNAEVRRVMLERFGEARYIQQTAAAVIDDDPTHGRLYRRDSLIDEPIVMLRVENSTLEPDGSRKIYWRRVPPGMRTAHEARAWTFDMTPDDFIVAWET